MFGDQQKMSTEKLKASQAQSCGQAGTKGLSPQGQAPYGALGIAEDCTANAEPLIYRLMRNMNSSEHEARKQRRAVEILERHPEFEELLELLRLVPIW